MGKLIDCPFCGLTREKSKEHVWAQWLHKTDGAQTLLAGTTGERIPMQQVFLSRSNDGRLRQELRTAGNYAKHLPHVTVPVCRVCNSGWMSSLEEQSRQILRPLMLSNSKFLELSDFQLRILSAWVTKSWMAYALTMSSVENPFTVPEYRSMAVDPAPLERSSIWLLYSIESRAHVGMGILSTLLEGRDEEIDFQSVSNNMAFAYVAVAGCVFFMILMPEGIPGQFRDELTPVQLRSHGARRIWPDLRAQYFPLEVMPDAEFGMLLSHPVRTIETMALPVIGLTEAERERVLQQYLEGDDPHSLRREWEQDA